MHSDKDEVQGMLQRLPEGSTYEDIQYHLYVLEKVNPGMERIDSEGGLSQEEVEERLNRWITK